MDGNEFLKLENSLSKKQKLFCEYYVRIGNATESCRRAGFNAKNMSNLAWKLIQQEKIKKYVACLDEANAANHRVTQEMLVQELKEVAFFDMKDIIAEKDGNFILKSIEAIRDHGRVIKRVKYNTKTKQIEVEAYDKLESIEKLAKYIGLYERDNEQKTPDNAVQIYLPSNGREKE